MSLSAPVTAFERCAAHYIRHQRALGLQFSRQGYQLAAVTRFLAGRQDLDATHFEAWLHSRRHTSPTTRRTEALTLRRFCLYRRRSEPDCFVPDPLYFPRRVPPIIPVILSPADIVRMLKTLEVWPSNPQHPLYKHSYRIGLILLYTTGLRRSELARLTLNDVDLKHRLLRIRESKFHKTRIVPLSVSTARELRHYLKVRLCPPWDIGAQAPLLGHQHGSPHFRAYAPTALGRGFRQLFRDADIRDPQGRYPRLHDLRHSFAVQVLLRAYRSGHDVQARLPQLSMYLGHVSIASTAYYLHFIPQIAAAADRRFARHFGSLAQAGVP